MKITNDLGLPNPIVEAIRNDGYSDGGSDISVTRLISPPRQVALVKGNGDTLSEDAADRIYSLLGQTVHTLLERVPDDPSILMKEKRLFATVLGWTISGQVDLVHEEDGQIVLSDYKVMSVWEGMNGIKPDKVAQLNLLAMLMRAQGINPNRLQIVGLYRDWSKSKAQFGQHPARQVEVFEAPLWEPDEAVAYATDRVRAHQKAQSGDLPECDAEERWERPTKYAVMKEGRKTALRVTDSEEDARDWMVWKGLMADGDDLPRGHSIEVRPGDNVRCANYCAAAPVCEQWRAMNV